MLNLSHRARGLLLIGVVWILSGASVLLGAEQVPDDAYPLALLPTELHAVLWLVTGSVAVTAALLAPAADASKWAFVGLLFPGALRMTSSAWSGTLSLVTDLGQIDAWVDAAAWAVVLVFVLHEAGTPEIPDALAEHGRSLQ